MVYIFNVLPLTDQKKISHANSRRSASVNLNWISVVQHQTNITITRVLRGHYSITRGGGGGDGVFELPNYLFHLLSAISYLFHTLPQAKHASCISPSYKFCSVYNLVFQTWFGIDVGVEETSEDRLQKMKCHLTMPSIYFSEVE